MKKYFRNGKIEQKKVQIDEKSGDWHQKNMKTNNLL